jgi:TRAP-type uncharacterized transport system fused permease subunit
MQAPFYEIIIALFLGVIAVALIAMGLEGWWFEQKVSKISRLLIIIAGIIILTGNIKLILISSAIVFIINYLLSKSYATK